MKKLKFAYHAAATALTVVSYAFCVVTLGKLASDLCAEAGKNYLETHYHKK